MNSIKGYILITRPVNLVIAFLSIFIGGFVTGTIDPVWKLLLASLSGMIIAGGANVVNDFFDIEIDRVNKPERPLPSGLILPEKALSFSLILFISGICTAIFVSTIHLIIAIFCSLLLYLYSYSLKRTVLMGNITVAFVSGMAFIYGSLATGNIVNGVIVAVFAFFFHLSREIIKDVEDIEGDRSQGLVTLPIRYGVRAAYLVTTFIIAILIVLTMVPYILNIFSFAYLLIVSIGVDLFLLYVIFSIWRMPDTIRLRRVAIFMKLDMVVGLAAVYFGTRHG